MKTFRSWHAIRLDWIKRLVTLGCFSSGVLLAAAEGGGVSGTVSNAATNVYLEGAVVEIPVLGRQALTDASGRFAFAELPPGEHTIRASYTGLEADRQTVRVEAGRSAVLKFDLGSPIYQLQQFVVTGEREDNAASITRQRNAANVKSVVALDAFGNLGNENPGELLSRLAGVAPNISDEGDVFSVYVRGIDPTLNSVNVDGNKMATSAALSREFRFLNVSAGAFEELEVVKAPTPDMDPDSLGGAVNMKTKSSLGLKEKRRFNYRLGVKWAPPFLWDQTPTRAQHRSHPITSVGYQEVFGVLGGERNLGVALNAFYIENPTTYASTIRDYTFSVNDPAYVYDYRTNDAYNLRKQRSVTLKFDYRLGTGTRLSLGAMLADAFENLKINYQTRVYSGRTIAALGANGLPTGTGAILPGFTDTFTQVRAVSGSNFETTTSSNAFMDRTRRVQLDLSDRRGRWETDGSVSYSQSIVHLNSGQNGGYGGGGSFVTDVRTIGWTLDQSASKEFPTFTQTAGPSILDLRNYGNNQLTQLNGNREGRVYVASLDAKYQLGLAQPAWLKAGARWRRQESGDTTGSRRFTYVGADGVTGVNPATGANDDDLSPFQIPGLQRTADYQLGAIPFVHTATLGADVEKNPARWREDVYFRESERLAGTRKVTEDVSSVYLMGGGRWGKFGVLTGARVEKTEVTGVGWARRTTLASISDPALRAATEYGARKRIEGSYTDVFPGLHGTYAFARGLLGRASWSSSIGRPAFSNLVPREDVNVTNQTVTINNPSLSPQYSDNLDLSLEYYFEPVGLLSIGAFQKDLTNFIFTDEGGVVGTGAGNGYEGQYAGYTIVTQNNGGSARILGLEAAYQQELTFLPAVLRGFGVFANYTLLTTEGNYGGTGTRSSNQVARFVPRSANAGLSFKRDRFSARVLVNYVGEHLYTYSTDPSRLRYKMARTLTNLSLNYQLRRGITLYCDFNNLLQAPQRYYIGAGKTNRLQAYLDNGPSLNFGVTGSF